MENTNKSPHTARTMSEENVEIVRTIAEAFARGDYEASLAVLDEEIEFVSPPDVTGGGRVYRGRESVGKAIATFVGTWTDYEHEIRNLMACGNEVLVEAWQRGRGKGSGVEVSEAIYNVWTVRSGRVVGLRMFRDKAKALEAAGLSD